MRKEDDFILTAYCTATEQKIIATWSAHFKIAPIQGVTTTPLPTKDSVQGTTTTGQAPPGGAPSWERGRAPKSSFGNASRSGSKSPQKYSRNNKDLMKVLTLSKNEVPTQDMDNSENEEMKRALDLSLVETSKPNTEEELINIAIKASLEDMPKPIPHSKMQGACNIQSWTWNADERREVENLLFIETPTSTEDVEPLIIAMKKPLKMWPNLYRLMDPIRKLLEPLTLFQWEGDQREAWEQTKKYILTELLHTDTDTDSEGGSHHQIQRVNQKSCQQQPQNNRSRTISTQSVSDLQVTRSAAYT